MGLERLLLTIREPEKFVADYSPDYFIAALGEAASITPHCCRETANGGKRVYIDFDARSLKSQMRLADKLKAKAVLIIGDEELKSGTVVLRDMSTKEQRNVKEEELLYHGKKQCRTSDVGCRMSENGQPCWF